MNDDAVYRTAPATPGLLFTDILKFKLQKYRNTNDKNRGIQITEIQNTEILEIEKKIHD